MRSVLRCLSNAAINPTRFKKTVSYASLSLSLSIWNSLNNSPKALMQDILFADFDVLKQIKIKFTK